MSDLDFSNVDFSGINDEPESSEIEPSAPPLTATVSEAFKTNPDTFAKQKQLSRDTGTPVSAVEGGELELEADVKFNNVDFIGLEFDNPGTSNFLKSYDNAVASQDDISILQRIEDTVLSIPAGLVEGFGMGVEGVGRTIEAGGRMTGRAIDTLIPDVVADSDFGQAFADLDKIITPYLPGAILGRQGNLLKEQAEGIADVPAERQNLATDIGKGLGQVSGQIVTALVNPTAALGLMFGQGVDQQGERQEASGAEGQDNISDLALIGGGAVTAVTEKMGLDALMSRIPPQIKNKIARQLADVSIAGGIEAVQEVVEGVAQGYLEQITTNADAEIFEGLDREAMAAGGVGVIVRSFVNMLTPGRVKSTNEQTDQVISQGEYEQNVITKLNDDIVSTKMQTRDADTMKAFIEQVDADQNTNIFIDGAQAAMFMQEKTPDEIAADPALEMIQDQVREAAALGGDVVIPIADFAKNLAGTDMFTQLQPHMTLSPEAVTPFRADQAKQETESYVKGLMTQAEENTSSYIESQAIYEDVKKQLIDSGQVNEQNAKVMAQVVPAWATVYAQKNSISIEEAYKASGLHIEGPQTGERARLEGELELLSQPELQSMLSMDEDAFIQAVNPEGKVIADDDVIRLGLGDFTLPETTETVSSFEADGQTISVVSDDAGNMYAVNDNSEVLGLVGPAEDNETSIDLVSEAKGLGVGKELAKAYLRKNPMAPSGGFTKAGEATYRAAFRELKAEQDQMLKQSEVQEQTDTPAFKKWSDDGEVVEAGDINDHEFKQDTPTVLKVFHGTTHSFSVFDAERGNMEGQFGAINYFTSSESDAHDNYAGEGPDLTNRIEQRAERLASDLEDQFEEKGRDEVLQSLHRSLNLMPLISGRIADMDDHDAADLAARTIAEKELHGGEDQTMELFVKVTNPFVIGEDAEWIEFIDDAEVQELAIEEVASDEDIDVDEVRDNIEDYEEQIDEARWRVQEDQEHPLTEAIQTVSQRHGIEASELASQVYDLGESARPEDIEQLLRTSDDYAYAESEDTGELIGSQLVAEVIQEMGYDSIILKNAEERFSNMNMNTGTSHVHIFDSGKTNIKSVDNQGTFDATDPDVFRQDQPVKTAKDLQDELMTEFDGVKITLGGSGNKITLDKIIIPEDQRGSGIGTEVMNRITDWADSQSVQLALTPSTDFGGSKKRLTEFYKRSGFVNNKGKNKDFEVSETMIREPALKQETDGTRGYYDPANSMIRLTEAADLSTFLHEFAHFMYEMELKAGGTTAEGIQSWFKRNADDVVKEANGYMETEGNFEQYGSISSQDVINYIDNDTTGDQNKDLAIRRAVHEQFARGFETYLMEGKAPSVELRNAFRTFARWLSEIYKSIRGQLNVNLDDEMRQVLDRMLATEEQIEQAETRARYQPMFTDAAMGGMTDDEFKAYNEQQTKVKDKQSETLRDKLIAEITRTTKQWWKEQKADITTVELEKLKGEKVYITQDRLRNGEVKLDLAVTKEMVGVETTNKLGFTSTRIPAKLNNMTKPGGEGVHPDEAAALFGYTSGAEMLNDLINVENINKVAGERAEEIMKAEHGDILNDGTIEKEADDAVQNEERGKLMLQELKLLRRGVNQPALERQTIKAMAEENIGKLSYNKIFPNKYRKAEIKAAQESATALANGDKELAANAKARQVLNYYLGMAATEARAGTDKIVTNMSRYNKKKVREAIMKNDHGYWEQIEKILTRFDFRKSATLKAVDEYNQSVESWMNERMETAGDELSLSNATLNELYKTHWKNVPYSTLTGISDSVKNIEHVARYGNKIDMMGDKVEFETAVADWTRHMDQLPTVYTPKIITTTEDKNFLRVGMAQMTKIPFLASWLDGGERVGMSHEIMMDGLNKAGKAEQDMWKSTGDPVMDAIMNRSKDDIARHMRSVYIPELPDGNMIGSQVLAVALNTGNAGNLRKMLLGEGWADPEVEEEINFDNPKLQAVLNHMTKSDWELVQLIWDQMDQLFTPLAEVHRKSTGLTPGSVEAEAVNTPYGTFKGGYYPVVYDHNRSADAARNKDRADAQTESMFGGNLSLNAQVNAGATNERTGYYGPINLNLDVIPNHFQETIHYITHHEPIRQLNRLITDRRVRDSIISKVGPDEYAQLKPWLNDIAKDGRAGPPKTMIDAAFGQLRMGVTLGVMGFKASTGIIQLSGIFNTYAEVGPKHVNKAMRTVYGRGVSSIKDSVEFAFAHSNMMETRTKTMDREIKNALEQINQVALTEVKGDGVYNKLRRLNKSVTGSKSLRTIQEASMKHIAYIQFYGADIVSWHAGYTAKLEETGDVDKAYKYADWVVENVQGSGATKDMATLMRNQSKTHTTFTMFMTFFSSLWNMERDLVRGGKSGKYSTSSLAAKSMFLFTLPVIFEMLMRGEVDDEDDEMVQKTMTKLVLYPLASVPFVRDVASGIGGDYGYNSSPVASVLEKGLQGTKSIMNGMMDDEEITKSQAKSASQLAGAAFKIPGISQAWATGEHIWDVVNEGEELTMHQLLFGPTKEQ